MRVVYHPDFPRDIKQFEKQYRDISERLALRFRIEVDDAIEHIKTSPGSAGLVIFRSIIPNGSDPLTWLSRLIDSPVGEFAKGRAGKPLKRFFVCPCVLSPN